MKKNISFVSHLGVIDKSLTADDLKMAFLWYDEIVWENLRVDLIDRFYDNFFEKNKLPNQYQKDFTDVLIPLSKRIKLENIPDRQQIGYPRNYNSSKYYHYPNPSTPEEYAHNFLLRQAENQYNVNIIEDKAVQAVEGWARSAIDNIVRWEFISQEFPSYFLANQIEKDARLALSEFNNKNGKTSPIILFKESIPSLEKVPWFSIIELKRKGRFDSLKKKMERILILSDNDLESARITLEREEITSYDEIIEQFRPKIKSTSIEAVLSNIPTGPIPNPISIYSGGKSIYKEINKGIKYNWLYQLRDIKSHIAKSELNK
ncbi:hypothetical protein SAMN06296241_3152 [Salinimicrobium sediminis]|uniref:Uncharacterized protein n=1 Tax=Salinimicrobium sediminis TaxID=1343891 RepID=A0A285X8C6_9FLAO|nr:hypothetical protein [Salinimicrobium sediminis]SOC81573.1 hypothetical protein SAMN06296241_3152 [Salinimicrobium sediminis]